jgi:Neuraminidase (sialidase)
MKSKENKSTEVNPKKVERFDSKILEEEIEEIASIQQDTQESTDNSGTFWIWLIAIILLIPSLYSTFRLSLFTK